MTQELGRSQNVDPHVLLVSTKYDPHVDLIVEQLTKNNFQFTRFNTEDFPLRADIQILFNPGYKTLLNLPNNPPLSGEDITSVWYRRPSLSEFPSTFNAATRTFAEQETKDFLRGLWELFRVTWVNHPEDNRRANIKIHQLKLAQEIGLVIPDTILTNNPDEATKFYQLHQGNIIIKPLSRGVYEDPNHPMGIYTNAVTSKQISSVNRIKYTPVLLQENIPKDVELRITIVDNEVFTAEIHSQLNAEARQDWRRVGAALYHKVHALPNDISQKCLLMMKTLNLKFGAIDMIVTPKGEYVFLEINPNGQWAWIEELTGLPIANALIKVLTQV